MTLAHLPMRKQGKQELSIKDQPHPCGTPGGTGHTAVDKGTMHSSRTSGDTQSAEQVTRRINQKIAAVEDNKAGLGDRTVVCRGDGSSLK